MALSYGSRSEIARATRLIAEKARAGVIDPMSIDADMVASHMYLPDVPDPDLVIRTSGEQRISNFLLWQIAYAEFHVTETLWPDFGKDDLLDAVVDFGSRERRFGGAS